METTVTPKKEKDNAFTARKIIRCIFTYIFLVICAIIVLLPFYWMIMTSFKTTQSYNSETFPEFYVSAFTVQNYINAFTFVDLPRYLVNTLIYSVITTALMIIVTIPAAFAFARLKFRGKDLVFTIFLAMMMIPNELVIITNYTTIVNLDLRNTFIGMILPSTLSVFYIYLLRQNFMQVPDSLYYAAKVDGYSDFKYMTKVLMPLSKPTIISILVLKLIECWNAYIWPNLITTKESYYLVSTAIQQIRTTSGLGLSNIPGMMAAVVIVSLPLFIIYLIFRKQIMSGVSRTGTKG